MTSSLVREGLGINGVDYLEARAPLSNGKVNSVAPAICPWQRAAADHFLDMQQVAENLWVIRHPMKVLGADLGRTVTLVRLGGQVVVHSTAPFSADEVAAIRELGQPAWMLDAAILHDTYAKEGRAALPEADYYVPPGFPETGGGLPPKSLSQPPAEWQGQLEVLALEGMPSVNEHVLLHVPSRTLIVADLIFNVPATAGWWVRFLLRVASGLKGGPGMSRLFLNQVKDRAALSASLKQMMEWDFDRVIVGHGNLIAHEAKPLLAALIRKHGL